MHARDGAVKAWRSIVIVVLLALAGCATQTRLLLRDKGHDLSPQAEVGGVTFYPQERFQCGPAALAMLLNSAGIPISPDALVPQVYVPQREGSLPPEMLAAARRNGAFSMVIPPRMDVFLRELAARNPVIVLQNLSLPVSPLWHYAVAIGYDLGREEIILRSGTTERLRMPMNTFENTWKRSGYWAMVALPPGRLPATPDEAATVDALVAYEKSARPEDARIAYGQAVQRRPRNFTLQMGLGNAAFASGDLNVSERAFRAASEVQPDAVPALNNLANVLAEMGELERAAAMAERAVALGGGPWKDAAASTLQMVRGRQGQR